MTFIDRMCLPSRLHALLAYVILAATLGACGESPFDVPGGLLTVAPDSVVLTSLGGQTQLQATIHDAAGAPANARVTWRSSNEDIAIVDVSGRVTAIRAGITSIEATAAGLRDSVAVVVVPKAVFLEILGAPASAEPGDTIRLQLRMRDARGNEINDTSVVWLSSEDFAPVDSTGMVLVRTAGIIKIIARAGPAADTVELTSRVHHVAVSAGGQHTCSLTADGDPYCWGANGALLGYGSVSSIFNGPLLAHTTQSHVSFASHVRFVQISAGSAQSCGVAPDQRAYCWGPGAAGVLNSQPWHVTALNPDLHFESISSGRRHACGVMTDQTISCWGFGISNLPRRLDTSLRFSAVSSGGEHTCAIGTDQRAYCWGSNRLGQLGIGTADTLVHADPIRVAGEISFVAIAAGGAHTCGIDVAGTLYCWGSNAFWQLTSSPSVELCDPRVVLSSCATVPSMISTAGPVSTVSAGDAHTCALIGSAAYCWGDNAFGKAGGTLPNNLQPTPIAGSWTAISAGTDHSCGIRAQTLVCWGSNSAAQIGLGKHGGVFTEPQPIIFQPQP